MPAASKQLHISEKEAPCNEHLKLELTNSQIMLFELLCLFTKPELVGHLIRNRWRYTPVIKTFNLCLVIKFRLPNI